MKKNHIQHMIAMCTFLVILMAGAAVAAQVTPPAFRMPTGNTKFENITVVIFDTETTGFSPAKDRLVEIGAVKVRNGEVLGERTWLINPKRYIPYYVQEVHNITSEMVKDQPTFAEVYPEFLDFINGCVLIAHNAPFDIRFIAAEAERNNLPPPKNAVLDSLALFRNWYPELKSHRVSDLIDLFSIETDGLQAHRATDDSLFVYYAIQKEMEQRNEAPRFKELLQSAGRVHRFVE
ncbi:MAG: 3'-5' exonuclease [Verrucomicrobiota bacterium]|jgi:DNA polymerase-3 subunit alpha (Gram-positive type)|nr:3'-5' exonuclease [Verrucomicrobiota bacterium]